MVDNGCSLVLQRWSEELTIENVNMLEVMFWAQVHNLPLDMMTKRNREIIRGRLGGWWGRGSKGNGRRGKKVF